MNTEHINRTIRRVTWGGTLTNVALAVLKLGCGVFIGSHTMIADGIHSFSDLVSDAMLLIGVHFWSMPPDANHQYGHARIETVATTFIGLLLAVIAISIGINAVEMVKNPPEPVQIGAIPIIIMVISIIAKEILYRWTDYHAKKIHSTALHANAWHHRSDAISSIPALIAIIAGAVFPSWKYIDAIGASAVACMLLVVGLKISLKALSDLSDYCPHSTIIALTELAKKIPGVEDAHALRARRLGADLIVDLHIEVDPDMTVYCAHEISEQVQKALIEQGPHVIDVIVHIEPRGNIDT